MAESSLTTLIDDEMEEGGKWLDFVDGEDGFFYGIPFFARRVVKFNPLDKSLTEIGPDLGESGMKWCCGVRAKNGSIYCAPDNAEHILKIDTIQGTVEILDDIELPETGRRYLWASGALAADNSIYFMPTKARRIMKLNPDNDSLSSVGGDLGGGEDKYCGTVVGNDDYLYGIPNNATHIVKFDPTNPDTTSTVGEEAEEGFDCDGNGVLAGDGYIYAANAAGQVLQIDTTSNNYIWIGDRIYSGAGWGDLIVGVDKCIYWPPYNANRVLKFDPGTQQLPSLVLDDFGGEEEGGSKWHGGALATDEAIYSFPFFAQHILAIDPFKELTMIMQNNIIKYPEELDWLFAKDGGCNETFYGSAVRKFGIKKVFKFLFEECLPSDEEWANTHSGNLPLFTAAASSCESCAVSVIYHLLRRYMHDALSGNNGISKKRKLGDSN
jgi:hypothetical protein